MHHISAEWRYISLGAWLRGSLQWAESSERIHSSLRDNTEVSFTEELQTFRRYTAWHRERFRASTSCNGIQIEERAAQGQILNIRSSEFGFGLSQEPNGERKKSICQPTTAAKDIWSFALEGLVLERLDYLFWSCVPRLLGLEERNTHREEMYNTLHGITKVTCSSLNSECCNVRCS